jgi:hypothetical protein
MNDSNEAITKLIQDLVVGPSETRRAAARELYACAKNLAEMAILDWRKNPEIAPLISQQACVGVAVTPDHFAKIRKALGVCRLADVPPDQDAEEFEWSVAADVHFDILTSRDPNGSGAIARFLAKFGEGIQQVEFFTADVDRATELIRFHTGVAPVYPSARPGAGYTRVNFFLVGSSDGRKVLVELVERSPQKT